MRQACACPALSTGTIQVGRVPRRSLAQSPAQSLGDQRGIKLRVLSSLVLKTSEDADSASRSCSSSLSHVPVALHLIRAFPVSRGHAGGRGWKLLLVLMMMFNPSSPIGAEDAGRCLPLPALPAAEPAALRCAPAGVA